MVLLHLSTAFDTVDHKIIISWSEKSFGIQGTTLKWLKSYLENRTQTVSIQNKLSEKKVINYSIPQGSVLGPREFCIYTKSLFKIIQENIAIYQFYADDSLMINCLLNSILVLHLKPKMHWVGWRNVSTKLGCGWETICCN